MGKNLYRRVYYANLVLERISDHSTLIHLYDLKGRALFHRAFAHYHLLQLLSNISISDARDNGIYLMLHSRIDPAARRSKKKEVYRQVIQDLTAATCLLENCKSDQKRTRLAIKYMLAKVNQDINSPEFTNTSKSSTLGIERDLYQIRSFRYHPFLTL